MLAQTETSDLAAKSRLYFGECFSLELMRKGVGIETGDAQSFGYNMDYRTPGATYRKSYGETFYQDEPGRYYARYLWSSERMDVMDFDCSDR